MVAKLNFFPLGNADTLRIDLPDGRKMLIDYAAVGTGDSNDKRCDLPGELHEDLVNYKRNYFDVVCITHIDSDHCKGFGEFFWLDHAKKYQDKTRIKIEELWVPAAAILEKELDGDALLVQTEARYRLKQGNGIRVFSKPENLKAWMESRNIDFDSHKHLIVDAGKFVPGFEESGEGKVQFFVHSPFGFLQNKNGVIDRNQNSIVLHATFLEGGRESRLLLAADVDHEILTKIVKITRKNGNQNRLLWDIMKLPHHCSYTSIGSERGVDQTKPSTQEVEWLFKTQRQKGAVLVSTSNPIPAKGSEQDESDQPPHRQAAKYHNRISDERDGDFVVTMEHPREGNPKPFTYKVTASGIALAPPLTTVSSSAAASTPKAG